jgi:hypothetical protein
MPINHRSILRRATIPAAALLVGSALAISAADGQTARTLTFAGSSPVPRDFKQVDLRPPGFSNGDHFLAAITLRAGGRIAGRAHVICTIIDRRYQGQDCNWVLVFRDGTITASGGGLDRLLPGQPTPPPHAPDEYAITGGTGAYHGASGTLTMQTHKDDSSTITLSI